jgi:hypothetical protein
VTQVSEAGLPESYCINMNVFWSLDGPFEGASGCLPTAFSRKLIFFICKFQELLVKAHLAN